MCKSKSIKCKSRIWALLEISSFSFRPITICTFGDSVLICRRNISKIIRARIMSSVRNVVLIGWIKKCIKIFSQNSFKLFCTVNNVIILKNWGQTADYSENWNKHSGCIKANNFLTDYATIRFLRKTVLHWILVS